MERNGRTQLQNRNPQDNSDWVFWENNQLCYIGQDSEMIPSVLGETYGLQTRRLDLSYNNLKSLKGLHDFLLLEELILDNNSLNDSVQFPSIPTLQTLSLNKNKITDLENLLDKLIAKFPSLTYLSLLGNAACPNQLSSCDKDEEDYQRYRYFVLYKMPRLKFLDSTPVKQSERKEAARVGAFTKVVRPSITNSEVDGLFSTVPELATDYSPLPKSKSDSGSHSAAFGVCKYRYSGKHSEGNRFIRNNDL